MIAVVEKFAGRINASTIKTGTHNGKILSLKEIFLSFIFDKYLATYVINTTEAKVDA